MSRDNASLLDIYEAGRQALSYAQGLTRSELQADRMRVSAILYQIVIIGEATKRLSSEFRLQHPEISWNNMAGMRDIVTHQYDRVDFNTLWSVIQHSIPSVSAGRLRSSICLVRCCGMIYRPDSDIDVMVKFSPDARWGLLEFVGMKQELETMFEREVDLLTRKSIEQSENWIRRKEILGTARLVYVQR